MKVVNQYGSIGENGHYIGMVMYETFLEKFLAHDTVNHFINDGTDRILTYEQSNDFFNRFLNPIHIFNKEKNVLES